MGDKTTIRRGRIGEPKVVPVRDYQWTAEARGRFLDHLAATCNVRAACVAAGRHYTGAYALRRRDPAFAEQWQTALENGYDTLEAALLEHAIAPLHAAADDEEEAGAEPVTAGPGFDPAHALALLKHHRVEAGRVRPGKVGGPVPGRASEEETNAAIMAALDRLDARVRAARPAPEPASRRRKG